MTSYVYLYLNIQRQNVIYLLNIIYYTFCHFRLVLCFIFSSKIGNLLTSFDMLLVRSHKVFTLWLCFSQTKKFVNFEPFLRCFLAGIRKLFVDQSGTKLVFLDDKSDGYIYCPVR